MLKIFLDSMIYLHYRPLDEIDFHDLLKTESISIIIPRITLKELDHEKNTNRINKIKNRAKKILNQIENWLSTDNIIKSNLYIEYFHELPSIEFEQFGLDKSWNDDYLIATIINYKVHNTNDEILLITQDSGPKLLAKRIGINYLELPDKYKLPVELDPIEIENKELRGQLDKIKNAIPEFLVFFPDTDNYENRANFVLKSPPPINEEYINKVIDDLKNKYPKMHPPKIEIDAKYGNIIANQILMSQGLNPIQKEEYERYNKEVDEYISDYQKYLQDVFKYKSSINYSIRFQIGIKNIGRAPAEDVDILIHFPDGFILFSEDEQPESPQKPEEPTKPMSRLQQAMNIGSFRIPNFNIPSVANFSPPSSFSIKKTNSYEVKDHFNRIKHGDFVVLHELFIIFDSYESAKSFNCDYILRPVNLPEPVTGQLHFIINKE